MSGSYLANHRVLAASHQRVCGCWQASQTNTILDQRAASCEEGCHLPCADEWHTKRRFHHIESSWQVSKRRWIGKEIFLLITGAQRLHFHGLRRFGADKHPVSLSRGRTCSRYSRYSALWSSVVGRWPLIYNVSGSVIFSLELCALGAEKSLHPVMSPGDS